MSGNIGPVGVVQRDGRGGKGARVAGWTLAIDFGTCFTTAAAADAGQAAVVPVEDGRHLPSLVCLSEDGRLTAGRAAVARAAVRPECAEPAPKRALLGAPYVRLGHRDVSVVDLVATVLAKASGEAVRRRRGRAPDAVVMTHPAAWGESERGLLAQAARRAGLVRPRFVPDPVAAARHMIDAVPVGGQLAVLDFGGTLDTAVLRRTEAGFELAGPPGGDPHLGGPDLDEALLALVEEEAAAANPRAWDALMTGDSLRWARARARLRDDVTAAKHALSDRQEHRVLPEGFAAPIRITRAAFEARIENLLARAVAELLVTVEQARLTPADLSAVLLTGGSGRVPRLAYLVEDTLGVAPAVHDDPQCAVALGTLLGGAPAPAPRPGPRTALTSWQVGRAPVEPARPSRPALPWRATHGAGGRVITGRPGAVYVGGTRITEYDAATGLPTWSSGPTPLLDRLLLGGDVLYGRAGDALYAVDAASGTARWAHRAAGTVVPAREHVYVHDAARLVALDAANGTARWRRSTAVHGIAAPGDGVVYAAEGSEVTALDAKTGEVLWRSRRPARTAPAVLGGVLYGSGGGKLYALDAGTGEPLWETASAGPPILADEAIVTAGDTAVTAHDPHTGRLLWRTAMFTRTPRPPAAGPGVVCVRDDTGCLCLDAADGRVRWRVRGVRNVPIVTADAAYAVWTSARRTFLGALDPATGATRWSIDFGTAAVAEPILVDGLLYTLTATTRTTSTVLAVDAATGRT